MYELLLEKHYINQQMNTSIYKPVHAAAVMENSSRPPGQSEARMQNAPDNQLPVRSPFTMTD